MTRILVHFGFHKTGTSTAERMLAMNSDILSDHFDCVTRKTWPEMSLAAKMFSEDQSNERLGEFEAALTNRLRTSRSYNGKPLCISNVDLSGRIPGFLGITNYSAVPVLAGAMHKCIKQHFGPETDLIFLATQRPADDWLKSLYWQNLKVHRLCDSFSDFQTQFAAVADQTDILAQIRDVIGSSTLLTAQLPASLQHRLGPASPILAAMNISRGLQSQLVPAPRLKVSMPQDIQQAFLEINQSDLTHLEVIEAKSDALAILNTINTTDFGS